MERVQLAGRLAGRPRCPPPRKLTRLTDLDLQFSSWSLDGRAIVCSPRAMGQSSTIKQPDLPSFIMGGAAQACWARLPWVFLPSVSQADVRPIDQGAFAS